MIHCLRLQLFVSNPPCALQTLSDNNHDVGSTLTHSRESKIKHNWRYLQQIFITTLYHHNSDVSVKIIILTFNFNNNLFPWTQGLIFNNTVIQENVYVYINLFICLSEYNSTGKCKPREKNFEGNQPFQFWCQLLIIFR